MNDATWKRATVALTIAVVALLVLCGYLFVLHAVQSIQIAFAQDMTDIFAEMRAQALQSNTSEAEGCLEYVVNYYPSGTKLSTGSRLDRIVERERAQAVADILAYLRRKAGENVDERESGIKKQSSK